MPRSELSNVVKMADQAPASREVAARAARALIDNETCPDRCDWQIRGQTELGGVKYVIQRCQDAECRMVVDNTTVMRERWIRPQDLPTRRVMDKVDDPNAAADVLACHAFPIAGE